MLNNSRFSKTRHGTMLLLLPVLGITGLLSGIATANAQDENKYFKTETITVDGANLEKITISGPPDPPPGFEAERAEAIFPSPSAVSKVLTVPAYKWVFGCSAVSGSMVAAYYDRNGYPNMYTGPTNGGVMPLDDTVWGSWWSQTDNRYWANNPLTASHNGVDGRTVRGSIDDYWTKYLSDADDPFIVNGWTEHSWSTAIGDYMKTSQSNYDNIDASTAFYNWTSSPDPLTCTEMATYNIDDVDGTYGRKLFYEARGYTVTDCYNRVTDNIISGGFSYADFKAQIDAGRPVLINLTGHSIVGVGYSDPDTVYFNDTWDHTSHSMTWGGSYTDMEMQSVSIVNLAATTPPSTGFNSQFNGSTAGWSSAKGVWKNVLGAYYRSAGIANKFASAKHTGTYGNFTYQVKMKRTGDAGYANMIIIRGKASAFDSVNGWVPSYLFLYTDNGDFSVWEVNKADFPTPLKIWTQSSAIVKNGWNTLKVTANGQSLKFYINKQLVWTGSDVTLKSGEVGFGFYRDSDPGRLDVDFATLTLLQQTNAVSGELEASVEEAVENGPELNGGTIFKSP